MNKLSDKSKALITSVFTFFLFILLFPLVAMAQEDPMSYGDAIKAIISMVENLKDQGINTASGLGLAYVIAQGLMFAFKTKLKKYAGKWRLIAVTVLSIVAMAIMKLINDASVGSLLTDSALLTAFSVLINQVYKQFVVKKDEKS